MGCVKIVCLTWSPVCRTHPTGDTAWQAVMLLTMYKKTNNETGGWLLGLLTTNIQTDIEKLVTVIQRQPSQWQSHSQWDRWMTAGFVTTNIQTDIEKLVTVIQRQPSQWLSHSQWDRWMTAGFVTTNIQTDIEKLVTVIQRQPSQRLSHSQWLKWRASSSALALVLPPG